MNFPGFDGHPIGDSRRALEYQWRRLPNMGMEPLADYVRMASEREGTKITIGD